MNDVLLGAIGMGSLVISLFFLRYWRSSRDRFFLYFAISFFAEGLNRFHMGLKLGLPEDAPIAYVIRAISYGLILYAILDKNRRRASKLAGSR